MVRQNRKRKASSDDTARSAVDVNLPSKRRKTSQGNISQKDVKRLEDFVTNGEVGDTVDFHVGKDRRSVLHRKCDELQAQEGIVPERVLHFSMNRQEQEGHAA